MSGQEWSHYYRNLGWCRFELVSSSFPVYLPYILQSMLRSLLLVPAFHGLLPRVHFSRFRSTYQTTGGIVRGELTYVYVFIW